MEWHQTLEGVFQQPNSETPLKTAILLRLDGKNHYSCLARLIRLDGDEDNGYVDKNFNPLDTH